MSFKKFILKNRLILLFFCSHTLLALFLGRFYAFAPDEEGYLNTFNRIYTTTLGTSSQIGGGWSTASKPFLWIAYSPAKILNVIGIPDYLSIRLLSILLITITLHLLLDINRRSQKSIGVSEKMIFVSFFIPSVFLWTSLGLRESFLFFELAIFLSGFNLFIKGHIKRGSFYLFLGSYSLVSTKSYLWACLMLALILSITILFIIGPRRPQASKFLFLGFVLPLITLAATPQPQLLSYIYQSSISDTGARSGLSTNKVYVDESENELIVKAEPDQEAITLQGNFSVFATNTFLIKNPDAILSRVFRAFSFDVEVQKVFKRELAQKLNEKVGIETTSHNSYALKPGKISDPLSMIMPAFIFLFGPFPFSENQTVSASISSFESPLWWTCYALIVFQFFKFRKIKFLRDPQILLTLIFLAGLVAASALVEVNPGTSFRHRSILLVPLLFLHVRLAQRATENGIKEL